MARAWALVLWQERKINFSAIAKYAKENNICVAKLSPEEKELLVRKVGSF